MATIPSTSGHRNSPQPTNRSLAIDTLKEASPAKKEFSPSPAKKKESSKMVVAEVAAKNALVPLDDGKLPLYVKNFDAILKEKGILSTTEQLFHRLFSLYLVHPIDPEDKSEAFLSNFYKCDYFHHKCLFTTNSAKDFEVHLDRQHIGKGLYCHYCTKDHKYCEDKFKDPSTFTTSQLLEHVHSMHQNQNYQCNLCFYRSHDRYQVFLHQGVEHLKEFTNTVRKVIEDKKAEMKLSTFEEGVLLILDDEDLFDFEKTEDETDDDDHSVDDLGIKTNRCATILYDPKNRVAGDANSDAKYYHQHGSKLDLAKAKKAIMGDMFYYCAYCASSTKTADQMVMHTVFEHPEFPVLVIDLAAFFRATRNVDANFLAVLDDKLKNLDGNGGSINNKLVLKLDDDDEQSEDLVAKMVEAFMEHLDLFKTGPSYSKKLVEKARLASAPKGVKRKHVDEKADPEESDGLTLPFGLKRRRLRRVFTTYLPAVMGCATMTVLSFTLYHLSNVSFDFLLGKKF